MGKGWVATIAPWFRLHLPSCGPKFESQAHHLCFFQFVLLKLYQENNENKQKEPGISPFKKNMEKGVLWTKLPILEQELTGIDLVDVCPVVLFYLDINVNI